MTDILILSACAFLAGFIDSVVGGGGLIQTPALLINLPNEPLARIFGTGKFAGMIGTSTSAVQYARHIRFDVRILVLVCVTAAAFSFLGSYSVSLLDPSVLKPVLFVLLIGVFVFTLKRKNFGQEHRNSLSMQKKYILSALFSAIVGFYDGFFGPGTGTFFILFFVGVLGFDFLNASAYAKVANVATNLTAFGYFTATNNVIWHFALPMAFCNLTGSYLGAKAAILKGNQFVRYVFLVVVGGMICRFGFDIFSKLNS